MKVKYLLVYLVLILIITSCAVGETIPEPTLIVRDFTTTLSERPVAGAVLGTLDATSKLDDLTFRLTNQSVNNALSIDSGTGEIIVNDEIPFDINTVELITAETEVTSGAVSESASIKIALGLKEETIRYFKDIALGFEFDNVSRITRKWIGDMKIFVGGSPPAYLSSELNSIIGEINQLTSQTFAIEVVSDTLMSNYYVYFGSGSDYAQYFPSQGSLVATNWGLFSIYWNDSNQLFSGHMYVDIDRANTVEQKHLLREELTQSLGLARDSPLYSESIFQQSFVTKTTEYAEIDKELIYLLYHPDMPIG
ncbi:MAG: DUF2927 domain-containing protein, partial [Marinoscillum sp.]